MLREVCSRYSVFCAVSLSILVYSAPVKAQVINNQTNYNSLTAIAGSDPAATDVTANIIANTGHDLDPNKNATGKAAYAYRFGADATTEGAPKNDPPGSVANLSGVGGGNTLSTIIVADDLQLQVNTTSVGNAKFNHVAINDLRFLVSNHNASALTVDAHIRIFDDDTTVGGNGGFPGTLLKSYDIGSISLNGNGGGYASATQVSVPSSSFGSDPFDIGFNQFNKVSNGHYRTRLWVGLFFTADAGTVTTTELANVGGVIYDPNAGPNDLTSYTPTTDFSVDGIGIGTSDDQFDGDDIDRPTQVGPTANYNTGTHKGYDDNFTAFAFTSLFTAASLDNSGHGPEANLTWLFGGNVVLTPEPGSFGLLAIGGLPIVALIRRRKR
jgi:hypothetical protein